MTGLKHYYQGAPRGRIRALALALIQNDRGQMLLHRGHDSRKNEVFYRPLGGGIEFGETAAVAVAREIREELGEELELATENPSGHGEALSFFENVFTFEGRVGHELILMIRARFKNPAAYQRNDLAIFEGGRVIGRAVWRSLDEITSEHAKLYPDGLAAACEKAPTPFS